MSKRYDLAVVIGRFQPPHNGHINLISTAFKLADRVLVVIGSADIARNIKNPFTVDERMMMLNMCFAKEVSEGKMDIAVVRDNLYNDQLWVQKIQKAVDDVITDNEHPWPKDRLFETAKVVLVGHTKEDTSYLNMFRAWDYHEVENEVDITATEIRKEFFGNHLDLAENDYADLMPQSIITWLSKWKKENPEIFDQLHREWVFINDYKMQWSRAPFQPVFTTTDAVVICSGHILLVKRRHEPGKGLWALPGGFLGNNEFIKDSMLRELKEETRIKVDDKTILASIKAERVFDAPSRSERGRTITHAFLINLGWGPLPRVRGSDDAERAKWFPLNRFFSDMGDQMYEDHYDIATTLITS